MEMTMIRIIKRLRFLLVITILLLCFAALTGCFDVKTTEPWQGVKQFGTTEMDAGSITAIDKHGNIYVAGFTFGSFEDLNSTGLFFVSKYNVSGSQVWIKQIGEEADAKIIELTTDKDGNLLLAGWFNGESFYGINSNGVRDAFIIKMNSKGEIVWTKTFGSDQKDGVTAIETDLYGNIFVTGMTDGIVGEIDNYAGYSNDEDQTDLFVMMLNSKGDKLWAKQLASNSKEYVYDMAQDFNGNFYIVGSTNGDLQGENNAGGKDLFVLKYNHSGDQLWLMLQGSDGLDEALNIAIDKMGNIYVSGFTEYGLLGDDFFGEIDCIVAKYDSNGTQQWIKQIGGTGEDVCVAVATDDNLNVYVSGATTDGLYGMQSTVDTQSFIIKLDAYGSTHWTRQFDESGDNAAYDLTVDSNNDVFVTGITYGSFVEDGNIGKADAYLLKMDSTGNIQ